MTQDGEQQQAARAQERREAAEQALQASLQIEQLQSQAVAAARVRTQEAADAAAAAKVALEQAEAAGAGDSLNDALRALTLAEGAAEALRSLQVPAREADPALTVIDAAREVLKQGIDTTYRDLRVELNAEITSLARRFGIANLDSVDLKRNLNMPVAKGGAPAKPFGQQTAGERLRLRYALLIAILRVGARRGISTHPGLLLLDSLRAEEVQDEDAVQLASALAEIAAEPDGPQILTTTEDAELPSRLAHPIATIGPTDGDSALF